MKTNPRRILISFVLFAGVTLGHAEVTWATDFAAAEARAAREHKPLFLDFTGSDWCGYCMRLEDEVLTTADFESFARNYVLVRLDYPRKKKLPDAEQRQNNTLRDRYGIDSYPTVIVTDPTGKELARASGFAPGTPAVDYLVQFTARPAK